MMPAGERTARRQTPLRRSEDHSRSVITTGKLAVNLETKTVEVDGSPVHVTGREFQVLELLVLRKGVSVTKRAFMDYLYGGTLAPKPTHEPKPKIIDVFICKLRKKLAAAASDHCIETVWGRGYLLRDRVSEVAATTKTVWTLLPGSGHLVSGRP